MRNINDYYQGVEDQLKFINDSISNGQTEFEVYGDELVRRLKAIGVADSELTSDVLDTILNMSFTDYTKCINDPKSPKPLKDTVLKIYNKFIISLKYHKENNPGIYNEMLKIIKNDLGENFDEELLKF